MEWLASHLSSGQWPCMVTARTWRCRSNFLWPTSPPCSTCNKTILDPLRCGLNRMVGIRFWSGHSLWTRNSRATAGVQWETVMMPRPTIMHPMTSTIYTIIWKWRRHICMLMFKHILIQPHLPLMRLGFTNDTITETTSWSIKSNIIIWRPGWHHSSIHMKIVVHLACRAIIWMKITSTCLPLQIHIIRPCLEFW